MFIKRIRRAVAFVTSVFKKKGNQDAEKVDKKIEKVSKKIVKRVLKRSLKVVQEQKDIEKWAEERNGKEKDIPVKTATEAIEKAIENIEKKGKYGHKKLITECRFGEVHKFFDKKRKTAISGEINWNKTEAKRQLQLWTVMSGHSGIVPLYRVEWTVDSTTFVSPFYSRDLVDAVDEMRLKKDKSSLTHIKKWLADILTALEYMEFKNVCHTNLNAYNIYIGQNSQAVIGGLTSVNTTEKLLKRSQVGLCEVYCPPEACLTNGLNAKVDGQAVDMWAFGMMSCELLTFFALEDTVRTSKEWRKHVWPTMCYIMEETNFGIFMQEHFRWIKLSKTETDLAFNFVQSFLRFDPSDRSRPSFALHHRFLGKGNDLGPRTDALWTEHHFSFDFKDL